MPFCESCGSEIIPGNNFCSSCGAPLANPIPSPNIPVETLQIPPTPPSSPHDASSPLPAPFPPVFPSKPEQSRNMLIIAGVTGAIILVMIMVIGIPMIQLQAAVSNSPADNVPSSFGSPAPFPATLHSPETKPVNTVADSLGTIVYRSGTAYEQVYVKEYDLGQAQDVFFYTLEKPPLIIECAMNPKMVSREQLVDIGKASERYITSVYTDPNAWLDLKVTDADTGKVVTTIRFSKNYADMVKQDVTIRSPGNYRFELTGNLVSPRVDLLVKK